MKLIRKEFIGQLLNPKKKILIIGEISETFVYSRISDSIFKCYRHYEIYYPDKNDLEHKENQTITIEDTNKFIDECSLVVALITRDLLSNNETMTEQNLRYVISKNIEILPIVMEEISENLFNQKFGNFHLLYYKDKNFFEKLDYFINESFDPYIQIMDTVNEEIKPNVFLSYRKKDSTFALKLLNVILSYPKFEYLSVWFDDFLVAGEDYSQAIEENLISSDFVLMCLTKNSLEQGNYVLEIEYPLAKKMDKKIVAIAMDDVDIDLVKSAYPDLLKIIHISNINAVLEEVLNTIIELNIKLTINSIDEISKLGLKYLEGRGAIKNELLGFQYIERAAKLGCPIASEYLGRIFAGKIYSGLVDVDYDTSVNWLRISLENSYKEFLVAIENKDYRAIRYYSSMAGNTAILILDIYLNENFDRIKANEIANLFFEIALHLEKFGCSSVKINIGRAYFFKGLLSEKNNELSLALNFYNQAEDHIKTMTFTQIEFSFICYAQLLQSRAKLIDKLLSKNFNLDLFCKMIMDFNSAAKELSICTKAFKTQNELLVDYLGNWYDIVLKYEQNAIELNIQEPCVDSYTTIYNYLEQLEEFQSLPSELLKTYNAITLACAFREIPNRELLEYALNHSQIANIIQVGNPHLEQLTESIATRLSVWPINLG
ncbi:TPA: toll/interleukin-1 receptor domain-containing protein [Streptococcus suis]|nr:toll/interleukin-1 receptor domain-containing protein [Streptococcus suis]HEM5490509.1 toll/interleukin-1 receptor domain-containing protein [Streptococcus suis]